MARGLASAAVILSLAACGGDTLDSIQNDLANGEDVNINLSTNDDGNVVVSIGDNDGIQADDDSGAAAGDSDVRIVGAMYALTNQHDPSQQISAAADAASEPDRVNQVVAYARGVDGSLQQLGVYDTGGVGENIRNSGANPLASQDPLIVSKDQRFVFAVNAGSESISSFVINDDYSLTPASLNVSTTGSSGAQNPVSLTIYENILYVANTGNFVDANGAELDTLPDDRNRCLLYTSPSPRDATLSRMPSSA